MGVMNKTYMRAVIKSNGHLRLEGNETAGELREALLNLRSHTYSRCKRHEYGASIEGLVPDVGVLIPVNMRKKGAPVNVIDALKRL